MMVVYDFIPKKKFKKKERNSVGHKTLSLPLIRLLLSKAQGHKEFGKSS